MALWIQMTVSLTQFCESLYPAYVHQPNPTFSEKSNRTYTVLFLMQYNSELSEGGFAWLFHSLESHGAGWQIRNAFTFLQTNSAWHACPGVNLDRTAVLSALAGRCVQRTRCQLAAILRWRRKRNWEQFSLPCLECWLNVKVTKIFCKPSVLFTNIITYQRFNLERSRENIQGYQWQETQYKITDYQNIVINPLDRNPRLYYR
jgi:hypothetical protein